MCVCARARRARPASSDPFSPSRGSVAPITGTVSVGEGKLCQQPVRVPKMAKVTGVSLPLLVLCLLMGVPLSRTQTQQCSVKIMECSQIMSIVFASSSDWMTTGNKAAMELACNNATMKTCLSQARAACDSATLATFTNPIDMYCSPSGQWACQLEMRKCQAPIAAAGSAANPLESCPLYQQALNCLNSASQCQNLFIEMNVTQSVAAAVQMCAMTKGVGICPESMECFQNNAAGLGNMSDCSGRVKLIQCLGTKKDVCKYPPGPPSFENVYTAALDMCSDLAKHPTNSPDCAAALTCQMSSDALTPFTSLMSRPTELTKAFAMLGNSTFLCKMLEATASCFVKSSSACGYTPAFVTAMTSTHYNIMATCAGQSPNRVDDDSGQSPNRVDDDSGSIQWTTSAAFMLLTTFFGLLLVF